MVDNNVLQARQFTTVNKKGNGQYGLVFEVGSEDGDLYAFKHIPLIPHCGLKYLNEIDILCRVSHPHIIHATNIMTEHNSDINDMAIILPLADRTLNDIITRTTAYKLPIFYKLASALDFLHSNNILHLDIKASNVTLQGVEPYFIDFSRSVVIDNVEVGKSYDEDKITIDHRPPEILSGSKVYNTACDVWSFGIMMLYIIGGKGIYPVDYSQVTPQELATMVVSIFTQNNALDKFLSNVSDKYRTLCKDLLSKILTIKPHERITAKQISEHPLFDEFRCDITAQMIEPEITKKLSFDHREMVKLIIHFAKTIFPQEDTELLFLAVDIFNRVADKYLESTDLERTAVSITCLWLAYKITCEKVISLDDYMKKIHETVPETSTDQVLKLETEIIYHLNGILNVSKLYRICQTAEDLHVSLYHVLLSRDQTIYADVDLPAWFQQMKLRPGATPKNISIERILA